MYPVDVLGLLAPDSWHYDLSEADAKSSEGGDSPEPYLQPARESRPIAVRVDKSKSPPAFAVLSVARYVLSIEVAGREQPSNEMLS